MSETLVPQNAEAEKGLLSSMLIAPREVLPLCARSGLKPGWFYTPAHLTIYEGIVALWTKAGTVDFIELTSFLRDADELDRCGGAAFVTDLFTYLPTAANAARYIEILREKHAKRELIALGHEMARAESMERLGEYGERLKALTSSAHAPGEMLFADVSKILDSGIQPERPSLVPTFNGNHLFYGGRVNEVHAEPSLGKTNLAVVCAISVMRTGGKVLFIDPEDTPTGILARFLGFGCDARMLRTQFFYIQNPDASQYAALHAWAAEQRPALVVLDGLAEALTAEGFDENTPADVLTFFRTRIRPFTDAGAAVLVSDHVVKNSEERGRWARGSGAKLGRYDGAVYSASMIEGYSPTKAGAVKLTVAKDRNGGVGIAGQAVAELHFTPGESCTEFEFRPAEGAFKPTVLIEKVKRHLRLNPGASKTELRELGNSDYIDNAIRCLMEDGEIEVKNGPRGRKSYYLKEAA